ncbi:MAG: HNH endonuclease [Ignavibacteriales bacterium]|nr:HNH endonuclease [Ignavibacteriales bacterium]
MEYFEYEVKPVQVNSYPGLVIQDKEHTQRFKTLFGSLIKKRIQLKYKERTVVTKVHYNEKYPNRIEINNSDFFGASSPFKIGDKILLHLDDSGSSEPTIVIETTIEATLREADEVDLELDSVPSLPDKEFSEIENKIQKAGKEYLSRRLARNRQVTNDLKVSYGYRCQICQNEFSTLYGVKYVEPHHIVPFSKVKEDDSRNIVILCPNHHRIVEAAKAMYDYAQKAYIFPNGTVERLVLLKHSIEPVQSPEN